MFKTIYFKIMHESYRHISPFPKEIRRFLPYLEQLKQAHVLGKNENGTYFNGGMVFPLNYGGPIYLTYVIPPIPEIAYEIASSEIFHTLPSNNMQFIKITFPEIQLKVSDPSLLYGLGLLNKDKAFVREITRTRLFYPFYEVNNAASGSFHQALKIDAIVDGQPFPLSVFQSPNFDYIFPSLQHIANQQPINNILQALKIFIQENQGVLPLRIDSACTSGQVYNDHGCDCKWQLQQALRQGYIVIHDPFADGRGWGIVPKSTTELYKNNIRDPRLPNINYPDRALNSVEAAEFLYSRSGLGLPIDIRYLRYQQMGLELGDFLSSIYNNDQQPQIIIFTDNQEKVIAFSQGLKTKLGPDRTIILTTNPTKSVSHCDHCRSHIEAKHRGLPQFQS